MEQEHFDFPKGLNSEPRIEPSRKISVPRRGSSICAYCGARMPSVFLTVVPPVHDNRWAIAAVYHAPTRRWIATKGLRLDEGSRS
jgi:hypothetical protein